MDDYIGLDVSLKETAISIRRDGKRIWRGKRPSDPRLLAEVIRKRAPQAKRVVFETGPLSVWFYHALRAEGLPALDGKPRLGGVSAALTMAHGRTPPSLQRWGVVASVGLKSGLSDGRPTP